MASIDDMVNRLRRRIPDAPEDDKTIELMEDLIMEAQDFILGYTCRQELPAQLEGTCVKLAAIEYNRLGIEGETSHSEGSVSRSVETMPADIKAALTPWVLARTATGAVLAKTRATCAGKVGGQWK